MFTPGFLLPRAGSFTSSRVFQPTRSCDEAGKRRKVNRCQRNRRQPRNVTRQGLWPEKARWRRESPTGTRSMAQPRREESLTPGTTLLWRRASAAKCAEVHGPAAFDGPKTKGTGWVGCHALLLRSGVYHPRSPRVSSPVFVVASYAPTHLRRNPSWVPLPRRPGFASLTTVRGSTRPNTRLDVVKNHLEKLSTRAIRGSHALEGKRTSPHPRETPNEGSLCPTGTGKPLKKSVPRDYTALTVATHELPEPGRNWFVVEN